MLADSTTTDTNPISEPWTVHQCLAFAISGLYRFLDLSQAEMDYLVPKRISLSVAVSQDVLAPNLPFDKRSAPNRLCSDSIASTRSLDLQLTNENAYVLVLDAMHEKQ